MGKLLWQTKEIKCKNIKPCPFCGSEAILQRDIRYPRPRCNPKQAYEVICTNYNCVIYRADTHYSLTKKEAIAKWNNRVEVDNEKNRKT